MPTLPQLTAMLHVKDGAAALDFYRRAFNATILWQAPPQGGHVAQLAAHGIEFWIHEASAEYKNPSPLELGGTPVRLMFFTDDPDALFNQAVAAGATVRSPMQDRDYGWRDGCVIDPFGHRWEFGKPLGQWPPA